MADSRLERIAQYFQTQLNAVGKPAGLLVERQRSLPIDQSLLPAALIYLMRETVQKPHERSSVTRREAVFRVELRVDGEPADTLLDPLRQWVVAQMAADFSLGGLAREIEEISSQWDQAKADFICGASAIDFRVLYYTNVNDLTVLADS